MDWKINPSIRVALKTLRTLQLEIHEQQLANGCRALARSARGVRSVWRGLWAPTSRASLPPSTPGWAAFGTNGTWAFPESSKDITCALSPSRIQASKATNSDLQLYFPQLFVQPSSWPVDDGFAYVQRTWHAQLGTVQIEKDANSPVLGRCLCEHSWKHYRSLYDESFSVMTPLLTPLREGFAICNPKTAVFLIQGRLLVLFFFSWWMVDL